MKEISFGKTNNLKKHLTLKGIKFKGSVVLRNPVYKANSIKAVIDI